MLGNVVKNSSSMERIAALVTAIMAILLSLATFRMASYSLSPVPLYDDWAFLDPAGVWFGLFALKSEHRIVLSKLVFLADIQFLHGRHLAELAVNAIMLLSLGALYYAAVKLDPISTPTRAVLATFIILIFAISPLTLGVLLWAMHVQNVGVNFFALIAFLCLARSAQTRPEQGSAYYLLLAPSMFCGAFASLVSAPGVLVSILLVLQAAVLRMGRRVISILGIVAIACTWYYLHGNPGQGNFIATLVSTPLLAGRFFLIFLGSFVTQALRHSDTVAYPGLTLCFGLASLLILVTNIYVLVHRCRTKGPGLPQFAIFTLTATAFFLLSAGLVAGGRTVFGISFAYTEHYKILRALYWGNLLISVPACWTTPRAWTITGAIALSAAVCFAAELPEERIGLAYRNASLNQAGAAIASVVYDPSAWQLVNTWDNANPATGRFQQTQAELLQRTRQSVFYDAPSAWLGRQIQDLPHVNHTCSGSMVTSESSADRIGPYVIVKGWVRAAIRTDKLPQIILVDSLGTVRGFAAVEAMKTKKSNWIGYARLAAAPADAYLFQAGAVCHLVGSSGKATIEP